jgi:TonB family protein
MKTGRLIKAMIWGLTACQEEIMKKLSLIMMGLYFSLIPVTQVAAIDIDWSKPVLIEQTKIPTLPPGLLKLKFKGALTIRIEINEFGVVSGSQVVISSGSESLDRFVQGWVKDWRYLPRLKDDQPVGGFSMVVIKFDLNTQSFQAPSPITEAIQIPDVLVHLLMQVDR